MDTDRDGEEGAEEPEAGDIHDDHGGSEEDDGSPEADVGGLNLQLSVRGAKRPKTEVTEEMRLVTASRRSERERRRREVALGAMRDLMAAAGAVDGTPRLEVFREALRQLRLIAVERDELSRRVSLVLASAGAGTSARIPRSPDPWVWGRLSAANRKLCQVLWKSPNAVAVASLEFLLVDANAKFTEVFGVVPRVTTCLHYNLLIHSDAEISMIWTLARMGSLRPRVIVPDLLFRSNSGSFILTDNMLLLDEPTSLLIFVFANFRDVKPESLLDAARRDWDKKVKTLQSLGSDPTASPCRNVSNLIRALEEGSSNNLRTRDLS